MAYYDTRQLQQYIAQRAPQYGIDPDVALRVHRAEGGNGNIWQSNVVKSGVGREPSYGPWQFLVGGKGTGFPEGMGNQFIRETGLDPRDPKNVFAMTDFALKQASQKGWGQWYGARDNGISNFQGIGKSRNASSSPKQPARPTGPYGVDPYAVPSDLNPYGQITAPSTDYSVPPDLGGNREHDAAPTAYASGGAPDGYVPSILDRPGEATQGLPDGTGGALVGLLLGTALGGPAGGVLGGALGKKFATGGFGSSSGNTLGGGLASATAQPGTGGFGFGAFGSPTRRGLGPISGGLSPAVAESMTLGRLLRSV